MDDMFFIHSVTCESENRKIEGEDLLPHLKFVYEDNSYTKDILIT